MNNKIFVIGFNKTATTTLHKLFEINSLRSTHNNIWDINKYDCFSDSNKEIFYFQKLYELYPESIFILNTRSLRNWIKSRIYHNYLVVRKPKVPLHVKQIRHNMLNNLDIKCPEFILIRKQHYDNILDFFKDKKKQLIIVDIEKSNFIEFICDKLNFKNNNINAKNVTKKEKINDNFKLKTEQILDEIFNKLNYNAIKQHECFDKQQLELVKLYENNL
jgi:hypothetical protein